MSPVAEGALMGIACAAAFAAGVLGMGLAGSWRAAARRRAARARALDEALPLEGAGGLERGVIRLAMRLGHPGRGAPPRAPARTPRRGRKESSSADLVKRAGLEGRVDEDGLRAARLRLAGMGAAAGAVVGAVISLEMGLLLAAVAAAAGLYAPTWALRRLERERALELERSLPEMLEVVALGLRSGLSFDRSFQLYSMHFPSSFARSCASAQKSWSLGLRTRAVRFALLLAAAMLAGGAVSFAGLLGFIGLIVPHAARFLIGYDQKALVPLCALLGAAFTLLCDLLSRVLFAPYEIPVGIVLSFIGGPFFLMLLLRQKRGRLYD